MKTMNTPRFALSRWIFAILLSQQIAGAQLVLTGTNYFQNFNTISGGLPAGWSVRTNAAASRIGDVATNYNAAGKTWGDGAGEFGNCASTISNSGTNFIGTENTTTVQPGCTNRALAIRQTAAFGDPGAAFTLQITDTIGLSNLTFSIDLLLLKSNANSTAWTIQYAIGNSPNSFISLGTFADPGAFGATRNTYHLGDDASNQSSNLWIRVAALSGATGSGTRDTFGIDNFSLSWTTNRAAATPPCLSGICFSNGLAQINFSGSAADPADVFVLQTADQITGPYVDVAGITISQTGTGTFRASVASTNLQQFYRIKRP
jgi:hypothetical protein